MESEKFTKLMIFIMVMIIIILCLFVMYANRNNIITEGMTNTSEDTSIVQYNQTSITTMPKPIIWLDAQDLMETTMDTSCSCYKTIWSDRSGNNNNFKFTGGYSKDAGLNYVDLTDAVAVGPTGYVLNPNGEKDLSKISYTIETYCVPNMSVGGTSFINLKTDSGKRFMLVHLPWGNDIHLYAYKKVIKTTNRPDINGYIKSYPDSLVPTHMVFTVSHTKLNDGTINVTPKIYINGIDIVLPITDFLPNPPFTDTEAITTNPIKLWEKFVETDGSQRRWAGRIYYVKIYNQALNDRQINELYNKALNELYKPQFGLRDDLIINPKAKPISLPYTPTNVVCLSPILNENIVFSFEPYKFNMYNYTRSVDFLKDNSLYYNDITSSQCGTGTLPLIKRDLSINNKIAKYLEVGLDTPIFVPIKASSLNINNYDHTVEVMCVPLSAGKDTVLYSITTYTPPPTTTTEKPTYVRMSQGIYPWGNNQIMYDTYDSGTGDNRIIYSIPNIGKFNGTITELQHVVFRLNKTTQKQELIINSNIVASKPWKNYSDKMFDGVFSIFADPLGLNKWIGKIFYFKIYNYAITDDQIKCNYQNFVNYYK